LDKLPVEVCEANKALYSFYRPRGFLAKDGLHLLGIYPYAYPCLDHKPKVLRGLDLKLVLINV
jgi:hypothetical protein